MRVASSFVLRTLGAIGLSAAAIAATPTARAAVLIQNPFPSSYNNWVDPSPGVFGDWRIHLGNGTLMETSDLIPAGGDPSGTTNTGNFVPTRLIQDGFVTPSSYDLTARMYTSDDDGLGLIFGMQPNGDYFRVSMRQQSGGSFGHTQGLAVQKVIGGVVTQLNPAAAVAGPAAVSQGMIDSRTPFDVRVAVNGTNYEVFFNGASLASGSDAALAAGKVGVYSWAQRNDSNSTPFWGTEVDSVSVSDNTGVLFTDSFTNPTQWRDVFMANGNGVRTNQNGMNGVIGDDVGNYGADFRNGWIYDKSNGFEWATQTAPNVDFIGPAVAINEPGSAGFSDYQMRVRMGATDDDGIGLLVRVQDDDNFYRINFANQTITATNAWERAPRGLSVQKVQNGVWSELFRDNQDSPLFVYDASAPTNSTVNPSNGLPMFDVSVTMIGNEMMIQVIADPDGAATVINYPVIVDAVNPLLTGTVGFAKWGNEETYYMPYGGAPDPGGLGVPFLTEIPEPSTVCLAGMALAFVGAAAYRRRRG